jgi:hypothetical protein
VSVTCSKAVTVLRSWAEVLGLLPDQELVENIRLKQLRWGKDDEDV